MNIPDLSTNLSVTPKLAIIPNATHYIPFEQPEKLNELMLNFLKNKSNAIEANVYILILPGIPDSENIISRIHHDRYRLLFHE